MKRVGRDVGGDGDGGAGLIIACSLLVSSWSSPALAPATAFGSVPPGRAVALTVTVMGDDEGGKREIERRESGSKERAEAKKKWATRKKKRKGAKKLKTLRYTRTPAS